MNTRPLIVCSVLAVPCIITATILHDRPANQFETSLEPPRFVVEEPVATTAVEPPATTLGAVVVSLPPAPAVVVTQTADRGQPIQITPTVPAPTLPPHPHHDIWLRLAECESCGDWSINTGNGYYGGLQFGITSWRGVGGTGWPHNASVWEQMYRAELLLDIQGWGAWPSCSRQLGLR